MQTFLSNLVTPLFATFDTNCVELYTNCVESTPQFPELFWNYFTDALVGVALLTALGFACLALKQWITRKKFTKIDRELRWSLVPFSLMALTYFIFEKIFIVSTRPEASGKPWEPSFPSTHTMLTATIFFVTIIILPKYLKNRHARIILDLLMVLAVVLVAVGRVLANMHWPSDVLGGILFSAAFAVIYALILHHTAPKFSRHSSNLPDSIPKSPSSTHKSSDSAPKPSSSD